MQRTSLLSDLHTHRLCVSEYFACSITGAEIRALRKLAELSHRHIIRTYGIAYGAAPDAPALPFYMLMLELCACDLGNAIHLCAQQHRF